MKNLVLGLALCCVAAACTSSKTSEVGDANQPAVKSDCCATNKADCASKTECTDAQKAECSTKVCPVTGQKIN